MSRRNNLAGRCPHCSLLSDLCLCAELPRLEPRTRLCLVLHRFEARKPTNSGGLAARCLSGSAVVVHGRADQPTAAPSLGERRGLVLFPSDDAEPLTPTHAHGEPVTLFVPDGTWRQAGKMCRRLPWLSALPRVALPPGPPSTYRLRAEVRPRGLATMEAIARAMGILEGPAVQRELERVFSLMVERTLIARGALPRAELKVKDCRT